MVAFGETLWDLLPDGWVLGGAPFNFAYRVNSLGDRGAVVTRLGRDDLGRQAVQQMRAMGMELAHVQWDDALPTGTVQISFDAQGEPDYYIVPDVAYDRIELTDALLDVAASADCICFGTLSQRAETSRGTLQRLLSAAEGPLKLLDINLRKHCYSRETVTESLQHADILRLNDGEVRLLSGLLGVMHTTVSGFADEIMRRWELAYCVTTLGERGAFMASREGAKAYVPGCKVEVVDPCGSGDAFTAACIHGLLQGRPMVDCLEAGNALGAMVAAQRGATVPIRPSELEAFMACEHERICDAALEPFRVD